MDRNFYYVGIAFFGMVNGLFNQALVPFALSVRQGTRPGALVRQRVPHTDVRLPDGLHRNDHRGRHPGGAL